MPVKTTGAEFKRFFDDSAFWPEDTDTYREGETLIVDGVDYGDQGFDNIPDNSTVVVSGGVVFNAQMGSSEQSFEGYFKRWRKLQSTASIVVECDISNRDVIVAAIRAAGGRIV